MRVKLNIEKIDGYDKHHVYYGAGNRKQSEIWGCVKYLPHRLHNGSDAGVHFDKFFDKALKQDYQKALETIGWTREEFVKTFGRSYL